MELWITERLFFQKNFATIILAKKLRGDIFMNNLPLPLLIKALEEAIRLNLASDFIQMIEREISKRQAS